MFSPITKFSLRELNQRALPLARRISLARKVTQIGSDFMMNVD